MEGALWRQKLAPPQATFPAVDRACLTELEHRSETASVVLVHAPAGFGKTSLLRGLHDRLGSSNGRVAWLTLDPADNDPQRFLVYLDAALQGAATTAGQMQPEAAASAATFEAVIARISEDHEGEDALALFLDDFEVITSEEVLSVIRGLVAVLPPQTTLYVGSRRIPDLQLGRLRAQGRVVEAGPDELRFSPEESGRLLSNILGKALAPDLVERLQRRTEGWAAALQLAGLALQRRLDPEPYVEGFSGTSSGLASYLAEEILATQPPEVRDLLVKASIVDTVCADLCNELCGRTDSAELLRSIERDNLFVFPLDETGTWFRFHKLFIEFLQGELERLPGDLRAQLHRSAAGWFAAHDKPSSAVRHALLSGDLDYAASLADAYVLPFTAAGRSTTVIGWIDPLPSEVLDRFVRLKVHFATALSGAFLHRRAAPLIEELSVPELQASLDAETRGVLLYTIPYQLLLQDRFEAAQRACDEHIPRLDASDAQARAALMNVRNVCRLHLHHYADIEATEADIRRLATGVTTYGLVSAECIAGMSELAQGRLSSATAMFEAALQTAIDESSATSAATALAAACVAETLYERGELERAGELLARYLPTITQLGVPDAVIQAHAHQIRTLYWSSGYAGACQAINQLKRLGYERDLSRVVATAWAEHSRLALLQGDTVSADRYLQMAEAATPYVTLWDETGVTLRARLLLAQDRGADALELLRPELRSAVGADRRRYALKLQVLMALALDACKRRREALQTLDACLQDVGQDPFLRIFADEGPHLGELLRELLATQSTSHSDYAKRVLEAIELHGGAPTTEEESAEALTRRELEILALVADGLSNQAIAERLFLSLPTVKSHVRSLLRKLGAGNRTEAVATARRLRMLER
jgi:LuxR family maltose regulon positive regulatory protein